MGAERFSIYVCPVCKGAFGRESGTAKLSCPRCLASYPAGVARRVGGCDDAAALQEMVGEVQARLGGGDGDDGFRTGTGEPSPAHQGGEAGPGGDGNDPGPGSVWERAASKAAGPGPVHGKALDLASSLTSSLGSFTGADFSQAWRLAALPGDPDAILCALLTSGDLVEVRAGRYTAVE